MPDHLPGDVNIQWLFGEITDTGATGDPTKATREKGQKMTEALVKCIVDSVKALDATGWEYRSSRAAL